MAKGSMREQMPVVAALIDELRKAFGADYINGIMLAAVKRGEPVFWASEAGHTIGTPLLEGTRVVKDERGTPCVVVEPGGQRHTHIGDIGRRQKIKGMK